MVSREPKYKEEMRRCGNPACKCRRTTVKARWHGPYLYLYYWDPKKRQTRKKYLGPVPEKSTQRLAYEDDVKRGIANCANCAPDCMQRRRLESHHPRAGENPDVKWCYCGCNRPEPEPFDETPDPPKAGDHQLGERRSLGSQGIYEDALDKGRTRTAIKGKGRKWRSPAWWGAAEAARRERIVTNWQEDV